MSKASQASVPVRLLEPLTSFRFLAAMLVFLWHTHIYANHLDRYEFGYVGVSFFFILSGFILTYVYTSRLSSGSWQKIRSFYAARIAKIYPVHLLTFLVAFAIGIQALGSTFTSHAMTKIFGVGLMNLTLTQSFYPSTIVDFSFNGVAWSISDELFFYSLFPLIIYLVVRYRKTATPLRLMLGWAVIWTSLVLYFSTKQSGLDNWAYYILPPLRLVDFTAGIILGLFYLKLIESPTNVFERLRSRYFTLLEVTVLVVLAAAILISPRLPQTLRFGMFLIPFWAMVIFVFAWQKGLFSRLLSIKAFVFLGNVSFSFYMIHQLIIRAVAPVNIGHHAVASFIISVSVATAIYTLFEEPYRVRLKDYLEHLTIPSTVKQTLQRLQSPLPKPDTTEQPAPVLEVTSPTD